VFVDVLGTSVLVFVIVAVLAGEGVIILVDKGVTKAGVTVNVDPL
jgi:hypothetical protein